MRMFADVLSSGVPANCQFRHGDFLQLPFEDNTFDHVYVIEAACHAPEKVKRRSIARSLRIRLDLSSSGNALRK